MPGAILQKKVLYTALVFTAVVLPVALALKVSEGLSKAAMDVLWLVLLGLCAAPLIYKLKAKTADPFHPLIAVPLAYFLYFGLGPFFFRMRMDYGLVPEVPSEGAVLMAEALAVIGIVFFYAGYRSFNAFAPTAPGSRRPGGTVSLEWSQGKIILFIFSCLLLCVGVNVFFWISAGGIPLFIENYSQSERTAVMAGKGYLLAAALSIVPVTLLAINIYWKAGKGASFVLKLALLLMALAVPVLLVLNVERGILVAFAWLLVMNYHYMKGRLGFRKLLVAFLLVVMLAGLGGYLRSTQWSGSDGVFTASLMIEVLNEFDNYAAVVDSVPDRLGLQYGRTLVPLLAIPIPRAVLPAKDDFKPAGAVFKEFFGHDYIRVGERMTLPGELYMNFHVYGVTLGMFGFGALAAYVKRKLYPDSGDPLKVLLYCLTLTGLVILIAGDIVSAAMGYAQFVLPVLCLYFAWSAIGAVTAVKESA